MLLVFHSVLLPPSVVVGILACCCRRGANVDEERIPSRLAAFVVSAALMIFVNALVFFGELHFTGRRDDDYFHFVIVAFTGLFGVFDVTLLRKEVLSRCRGDHRGSGGDGGDGSELTEEQPPTESSKIALSSIDKVDV